MHDVTRTPSFAGRDVRSVLLVLVLTAGLVGMAAPGASAGGCAGWTVVPSPNAGTGSELSGVTALSPTDAWAVGWQWTSPLGYPQTLIEHWNGVGWKVVPSPNPAGSSGHNVLYAVAASSPSDVWAVGTYATPKATLLLHWNGSTWKRVTSPNKGTDPVLTGIAVTSGSDAWAVGYYHDTNGFHTLTEHWDGTYWKVVATPNPSSSDTRFTSVAASSPTDVWAVGESNGAATSDLIEHWNGSTWKVQATPNPGGSSVYHWFYGVSAPSSSEAFAVGDYGGGSGTLTEQWDGSTWSWASSPGPPLYPTLTAVAATSSSDAWAVGSYVDANGGWFQTLIEQWNGGSWSVAPSPNPGGWALPNELRGVAATSPSDAWAVGWYFDGTQERTLILHGCHLDIPDA